MTETDIQNLNNHSEVRHPRLFYIDDIPTPYRVGVFRRVATIWPGDFRVAFCASSEPGRCFDIDLSGLDAQMIDGSQWRPFGQANPFSFKWNPSIIFAIEAFAPDVVVLSGYAHPTMLRAAHWCLSKQIPYAITCETSGRSTATSGPRWQVRRRLIGWAVRNMAFGLPVGRESAAYLRLFGSHQTPMHYFPNTPDTQLFEEAAKNSQNAGQRSAVRLRYGLKEDAQLFVFVGRLIDVKRPLDVIRALLSLPLAMNVCLLIVGDGPESAAAHALAAGDPRVAFAGWIRDPGELSQILAEASALVLPSSHEPWGAVVNEAMAARTCVIATDQVGSAIELISDGEDGFLVAVADVGSIASAMRKLAEEPNLSCRMGHAAQLKAIRFGSDFAANNLVDGAITAYRKKIELFAWNGDKK